MKNGLTIKRGGEGYIVEHHTIGVTKTFVSLFEAVSAIQEFFTPSTLPSK